MELTSAFAVPIGHARLAHCDRLNRELEQLFLARETPEYRNPAPSHNPQAEMFESRVDLFTWPEPCIRELRNFMLESVFRVAMSASETAPEEFSRLRLNNHTWFHITRTTGYFVAHNHALASWSAVYCVTDGADPAGAPRGGLLRLFDTRTGADAFLDPAIQRLRPPFVVGDLELQLQAGQLVVFPSYLFHEVTPYYGEQPRITVASNCWFSDSPH
ncbi:MAG TPA: putative 2OG-Fe(II) oxygenase [Steroidobacteraceae bacterium]|nr:putative 2OG-Fe(II) oxygenase [Steroidobacteraceae bacterium]